MPVISLSASICHADWMRYDTSDGPSLITSVLFKQHFWHHRRHPLKERDPARNVCKDVAGFWAFWFVLNWDRCSGYACYLSKYWCSKRSSSAASSRPLATSSQGCSQAHSQFYQKWCPLHDCGVFAPPWRARVKRKVICHYLKLL